jgi:hypothetical protein
VAAGPGDSPEVGPGHPPKRSASAPKTISEKPARKGGTMRDIPRQRWLGLAAAAAAVIGVASSSAIAGSPSASVAALEHRFANPLVAAERLGIMSTLDNKNVLSHRIRWIAYPTPLREVGKVDFLRVLRLAGREMAGLAG